MNPEIPLSLSVCLALCVICLIFCITLSVFLGNLATKLSELTRKIKDLETKIARSISPPTEIKTPIVSNRCSTDLSMPTESKPRKIPIEKITHLPIEPLPEAPPAIPPKTAALTLEYFLGAKLLAWLGGLFLFLGISYFVKYSIDNNLISPELRITSAFLFSILLLVGAFLVHKKNNIILAQTLAGASVSIAYVTTCTAFMLYKFPLFTPIVTEVLLVVITLGAFLLSTAWRAQVIAVLGIIAGFAVPYIVATGQDNSLGFFSYIILLNATIIALAIRHYWAHLTTISLIMSSCITIGWDSHFYQLEKLPLLFFTGLIFIILYLTPYLYKQKKLTTQTTHSSSFYISNLIIIIFSFLIYSTIISSLSTNKITSYSSAFFLYFFSLLPLILHSFLSYKKAWLNASLFISILFGLYHLVMFLTCPETKGITTLIFLPLLLFFILYPLFSQKKNQQEIKEYSLSDIGILLSPFFAFLMGSFSIHSLYVEKIISVPFAISYLLILALTLIVSLFYFKKPLLAVCYLLSIIILCYITTPDISHKQFLFNILLGLISISYILPVFTLKRMANQHIIYLCSLASVLFFLQEKNFIENYTLRLYISLGAALLGVIFYTLKKRYYSKLVHPQALYFHLLLLIINLIFWEKFYGQWLTLSLCLEAFTLLTLGFKTSCKYLRIMGLILFGAAIIKLITYDLIALQQLYRVSAIMGTAVIAITGSILYQKVMRKSELLRKNTKNNS